MQSTRRTQVKCCLILEIMLRSIMETWRQICKARGGESKCWLGLETVLRSDYVIWTKCNALQHTATQYTVQPERARTRDARRGEVMHCNVQQRTATHSNTLQNTPKHSNTPPTHSQHTTLTTQALRCAVARSRMGTCHTALEVWRKSAWGGRQRRIVMQRSLLRLHNAQLASVWSAWHSDMCERMRQHVVMQLRLQNVLLALVWSSWHSEMCERRRQRVVMVRSLLRLQNVQLSSAWCTWYAVVCDVAEHRRLLCNMTTRMCNAQMYSALG